MRPFNEFKNQHLSDTDTSSDFGRPTFRFPPAPRLCRSATGLSASPRSCNSDSSASDGTIFRNRRRNRRRQNKPLPPLGVFWDIENCQVPKNRSASSIVQKIRELFFDDYREAEFIVVCDVKKENAQIIQDLHDAQVNLIHVSSTSKNAADEKLRQSLRRFAETHSAPSAVVLISGDINFAGDLSDLRYRKKIQVILVHNSNAADALISCANKALTYNSLTENLPLLKTKISSQYEIVIENLPTNCEMKKLRNRLNRLSDNCGGKVVSIDIKLGVAVLMFSNLHFAIRAQRRLRGEDVFGYKIRLAKPTSAYPTRSSARPAKSIDRIAGQSSIYQDSGNGNAPRRFSARPPKSIERNTGQSSGYCSQDGGNYASSQHLSVRPIKSEGNNGQSSGYCSQDGNYLSQTAGPDLGKYSVEQDGAMCLSQHTERSLTPMDDLSPWGTAYGITEDQGPQEPVELVITNLDRSLNVKRVLRDLLKQYVNVLNLEVTSMGGHPIAFVQLPTQQEAQYVISQLHHYKLGSKRLVLSYAQNNQSDSGDLKDMIIAVLKDAPANQMPLFKFIDLLEWKYNINVTLSQLHNFKDTVRIEDGRHGGRIISLTPEILNSTSSGLNTDLLPYCIIHCPHGLGRKNCYQTENITSPNINISLKIFSKKLHYLLANHMDFLPLLSFPICYQAVFDELLPEDQNGVPLEHLITCVNGVNINFGGPRKNVKYILRSNEPSDPSTEEEMDVNNADPMRDNLSRLSKEIVELLRTTERCHMPVFKFIPSYHNFFGRQCRVADYGFVKLNDLLQAPIIAKTIQIMGDGANRAITLTHQAQIRRFTFDLLKVLRRDLHKSITLSEFPTAYEKVMKQPFNPADYGLCQLEDLLNEVPKHAVILSNENSDEPVTISIPKRTQTAEQILLTKQFAEDVIQLLYHTQGSMPFNKFIPAYHHHFGLQCRVGDYGFLKLADLFEAIPETVRLEELPDGNRMVCLRTHIALKILGSKIRDIIYNSKLASIQLDALPLTFLKQYGESLCPQTYKCENLKELITKLSAYVEVFPGNAGPLLHLTEPELDSTMELHLWALLLEPPHALSAVEIINQYQERFHTYIFLAKLTTLKHIVTISENEKMVQLTPIYVLAAEFYHLLFKFGGRVLFTTIESNYRQMYKKAINFDNLNVDNLPDLFGKMTFAFVIRKFSGRTTIILHNQLDDYGIPLPNTNTKPTVVETKVNSRLAPPPPLPLWKRLLPSHGPPKPDTPPAGSTAQWHKIWGAPELSPILQIQMPIFRTPKKQELPKDLLSPMKGLLPQYSMFPGIASPHPAEVPMPVKLLGKEDSSDSGVTNTSDVCSEIEMNSSGEKQTGTIPKVYPSSLK